MDFNPAALLAYENEQERGDPAALAAMLRQRQAEEQAQRAALQESQGQQQGRAARLRGLALMTSLGRNPLLRGIQQEASGQGQTEDANAARTGNRLAALGGGGMDPAQALLRLRGLGQGDRRIELAESEAARKAKAAAGATERERQKAEAQAQKDAEKAERDSAKAEGDMRAEFLKLPAVQQAQLLVQSHRQLKAASPTGVGDLQKIFAFTNLIDPGSVVKQEDVNNVGRTGGLPGAAQGYFNKLSGTGSLPDAVRKELDREADVILSARLRGYEDAKATYEGYAKEYKLNPSRAVPNLGIAAPGAPRVPAATALPKDASGQPTLDTPNPAGPVAKRQYSKSRDMTREVDAQGNVIREYKGPPRG